MKKIITILMLTMFLVSLVPASQKITNIPEGMSGEEFKQKISLANLRGFLALGDPGSWKLCERTCIELLFQGDCNPCNSDEISSDCIWSADSMTSFDPWSSANAYCNDWAKPYDYYNRQCYCAIPVQQCSGGADPDDRKCEGDDLFVCDEGGVWSLIEECQFGCSAGSCQSQQCVSHYSKKCHIGDVYWYDSCGVLEDISKDCDSNEVCSNAVCEVVIPDECETSIDCDEDEVCSGGNCVKLNCGEGTIADNHECKTIGGGGISPMVYVVAFVLIMTGGFFYFKQKSGKKSKRRKK